MSAIRLFYGVDEKGMLIGIEMLSPAATDPIEVEVIVAFTTKTDWSWT